jgi:hypothetical protein
MRTPAEENKLPIPTHVPIVLASAHKAARTAGYNAAAKPAKKP